MRVLKADDKRRIYLRDAKPGQIFSYANNGNGTFTLTLVKEDVKPRFPKGSLLKYFTGEAGRERNKQESEIASGCLQGPPE